MNSGVVFVHMLKPRDSYEWEYLLLALDAKGYTRIILEQRSARGDGPLRLFGVKWR